METTIQQDTSQRIVPWSDFLTNSPPAVEMGIRDALGSIRQPDTAPLLVPHIKLYCSVCEGKRNFESTDQIQLNDGLRRLFMTYSCRDCGTMTHTFALIIRWKQGSPLITALKIGQWPAFGPPPPSILKSLLGQYYELFTKGLQAESHGIGFAAFTYYSRIVELLKDQLFVLASKVSQKTAAPPELTRNLLTAKREKTFGRAVEVLGDAFPEHLRLQGKYNPFQLLRQILINGENIQPDGAYLKLAQDLRAVLAAFAAQVKQYIGEDKEFAAAVEHLDATSK
ncbi:MAG: hypothetical protein JW709_10785 [Sedimentisphaerales bacterium]|nr:hypothetical protein [Sedimentisphaerales bacterium]